MRRLAAILLLLFSAWARGGEVFPVGGVWRMLKGTGEATTPDPRAWRQADFDDGSWAALPAPFQYGEGIGGTELADMPGGYTSIYLRREFVLTNVTAVKTLVVSAWVDDGAVVWLNGVEVARFQVPDGEPTWSGTAAGAATEPLQAETLSVARPWELLREGRNVLAVQAFNVGLSDADFRFDASLTAEHDTTGPVIQEVLPGRGAIVAGLSQVEVIFDEAVAGVEASDLLMNGAPATEVVEVSPGRYLFSFPAAADGEVEVVFRPDHGITDTGGLANPFGGDSWTYRVDPRAATLNVRITEFLADNEQTLRDEDGEPSDWIEVHNGGEEVVGLAGWGLSDESTNRFKWRFPDVVLDAGEYLVIFASGKNRTNVEGRLHTNFRLSASGDFLALTAADGVPTTEWSPGYPPQRTDVSFGLVPGDLGRSGFFPQPTPGALNLVSGEGFAPDVMFSRESGSYVEPFALSLSAPGPSNVVIRYSLDGSLPTNGSPVYAGPILVTNSLRVRARAEVPGSELLPGQPRSEAYTRVDPGTTAFQSDLPLLVLSTYGTTIGSARNAPVTFELHEPVDGIATLTNAATFAVRGGAKVRGSSTGGLPKASYAIEWWDEFNEDLELGILGMPAESEWVLYAPNVYDPVLIHNPFIHQLSRDIGQYSPRTRFVEVFLNRGGILTSNQYVGIYVLLEKITLSKDRTVGPKLQPENLTEPSVTGGYLMKFDRLDPGDSGINAGGANFAMVDPKERILRSTARRPQFLYLTGYLNAFYKALASPDYRDPILGYQPYVEIPHWLDYHIVEVLSGNVDAIVLSSYFFKPREGRLHYGVHWDFDRALGSTDGRDADPRRWLTGPFFNGPWWNRICSDANFWQRWVDRYQELRRSELSLGHLHGLIDRLAGEVRQAQPRDRKRWSVALRGGSYQSEVDLMKRWVSNRVDFIDRQLAQPPMLSHPGGAVPAGFTVELRPPAGPLTNTAAAEIYFTLDGSDPRGHTNLVGPTARLYTGPITISNTVRVVARARDLNRRQSGGPTSTTPWSMPVAATYQVGELPLMLTEIHAQPAPGASGAFRPQDYEFLELMNRSGDPVELADCRFVNGVQYAFSPGQDGPVLPPGGRWVVAANLEAFRERYPGVTNVVGPWSGSLDDDGERITLLGRREEVLVDVTYVGAWYPTVAGAGFSLVLRDEAGPGPSGESVEAWRPSRRTGGSPGTADPESPGLPGVVINEALTLAVDGVDRIELRNLSLTEAADVSGWWLTDDFDVPWKYRLPAGTVLGPGGYLDLADTVFGADPVTGFELNGLEGDQVWLFSADPGGELSGFAHGFDFGSAERGVSFGRVVTTDGREHFAPLAAVTPGGVNAGSRAGPVRIAEVVPQPPQGGWVENHRDEFVELWNTGAGEVPLYDPVTPTNRWRLSGGVRFEFPPDVTLAAGERVLVVGFDPVHSPWALASFRARWLPLGSVRIFGPWEGVLANEGDTVRLERPEAPVQPSPTNAFVTPWIEMDVVSYHDEPLWHAAALASGLALVRTVPEGYGNEPASWRSGRPTAGDGDADGDGLPDRWEARVGLNPAVGVGGDGAEGDPDGDGFSNWEEYVALTDPVSAGDGLRIAILRGADGRVVVEVAGAEWRSYTLWYRDSLTTGAWQSLASQMAPAGGAKLQFFDPLPIASSRYYRVSVP